MVRSPAGDRGPLATGAIGPPSHPEVVSDRIVTVPNLLSALRLAGVPVFLWLLLGPDLRLAAFGVLGGSGITDYLDGRLARALGQTSRLGQLLDPAADRLTVVATVVGLAVAGVVPYWLVGVLAGRDLLAAVPLAAVRRRGFRALPVSRLGKAATLALLYAFPLLLLGAGTGGAGGRFAAALGWAFAGWGVALYWCAGLAYLAQARELLAAA